ncbi:MAG: putative Ig domain-containing protein [Leptospiraceae bacterium]|nr:putative Ig domain-containing protein [Leptospiraceae bacterium]
MKKYLLLALILLNFQDCNTVNKDLDRDFLSSLGLFWKRSTQSEVSGTAIKGAISGARVQILPLVNNACDRTGGTVPYAETTTDVGGNYAVRYARDGKPVCVLVTPASNGLTKMYDESLKQNISWTGTNYYLDSIIQEPGGPTKKGVVSSPFSRMASRVFAKTMEKSDASFANAVANASSKQVVAMFGLNKGFIKGKSATRGLTGEKRSPNSHLRSFGKRPIPGAKVHLDGTTRGMDGVQTRNATREVTPSLEDLGLDFSKTDDPYVAKALITLSGISALSNSYANGVSRSIQKGGLTRDTANGNALERVMEGFSQVIVSGGKNTSILSGVYKRATGKSPPASFTKNPLEATMQTGISTFVTQSGGGEEWGLNANEIDSYFSMSSIPPADLWVDTGSAPDYLYYADDNEEGAMLLYTNNYEYYYPWVEGGLPTTYALAGNETLPNGMFLDTVTGAIYGTPTTATTTSAQISIKASNKYGSTTTKFRIKVQNYVVGQAFAYVYYSTCTQNTTCNLDIGVEGVLNYNYKITGFTSTGGTFSVADEYFGSITGTAANVPGAMTGTLTYMDLNDNTSHTLTDAVYYYIDSNVPKANIWGSELVVGYDFSYIAFDIEGAGDYGSYSFLAQDFGNGMRIDAYGTIWGTPTTSGSWSPTVTVILASGATASVSLGSFTIGEAGTTPSLVLGGNNLYYSLVCAADGTCSLVLDPITSTFPDGLTVADFSFSDAYNELYDYYGLNLASDGTITAATPPSDPYIFATVVGTTSAGIGYDFYLEIDLSSSSGGGGVPGVGGSGGFLTWSGVCDTSSCTLYPDYAVSGLVEPSNVLSGMGLSIDGSGNITGTPSSSGTLNFSIDYWDVTENVNYTSAIASITIDAIAVPNKKLFISTTPYTPGSIGTAAPELANMDSKCNSDAGGLTDFYSMPLTGTYKAMVYSSGLRGGCTTNDCTSALDWPIAASTTYEKYNDPGTFDITSSANRTFSGNLSVYQSTGGSVFWTGMGIDFIGTSNCTEWTSSSGSAETHENGGQSLYSCGSSYYLLCIEQ